MAARSAVLSPANGPAPARVLFVGEAPGRLGADATNVPFHGDVAGQNFEELLEEAGLDRNEIFVTNAVLCNPRDALGNNAPPNKQEIANCSRFLRLQIDLVNAPIVVTLGSVALQAVSMIEEHSLSLRASVASPTPWYGRTLLPLYHPGARAMIHRPREIQIADYRRLRNLLGQKHDGTRAPWAVVASSLLHQLPAPPSYFAFHKLFYLTEYYWLSSHGQRLTKAYFIRQQNGPYCTNLHVKSLGRKLGIRLQLGALVPGSQSKPPMLFEESAPSDGVAADVAEHIQSIVQRYGSSSDAQLKTAAYLTAPMRQVLRREKISGRLLNAPLL